MRSTDALAAIECDGKDRSRSPLVCWSCTSLHKLSHEQSEEFFERVERALPTYFPEMNMDRVAFGHFELWEESTPNSAWLEKRLKEMLVFGNEMGLTIDGWSYEPLDRAKGSWIPQAWAYDDDEESN